MTEQKRDGIVEWLNGIVESLNGLAVVAGYGCLWLAGYIGIPLAAIYLLVRFVKWAWQH